MSSALPDLTEADFDAYLPARAGSNAFVRQRLPVKEKLLACGRALAEGARAAGFALEVTASDERPSVWNKKSVTAQWVFLWRDREARAELDRAASDEQRLDAALADPTPFYKHAFLALFLDAERFEVTLRVHRDAWADVKTLRQRLATEAGQSALTAALRSLPADCTVSTAGSVAEPAYTADAVRIAALLEEAVKAGSWLVFARSQARAAAVAAGAALDAQVTQTFNALLPLYALVAWRREDDLAAVGEDLARGRLARAAQSAASAAREAAREAEAIAVATQRRALAVAEARERLAALQPARPAMVHAAVPRPPERPTALRSAPPRAAPAPARVTAPPAARPAVALRPAPAPPAQRPAPPRASDGELVETDEPITLGARVRIRRGPFAGRVGTVTELDPRGVAKVALGLMAARVEAPDLITLGPAPR